MLARYILCDSPVLVRPSVLLGTEGPRDANSCRGTRVATSSYMRPIATDAQQWRGRSIHAAYCYWVCGRTAGWPMYRLCLAFLVSTTLPVFGASVKNNPSKISPRHLVWETSHRLSYRPSTDCVI